MEVKKQDQLAITLNQKQKIVKDLAVSYGAQEVLAVHANLIIK